MFGRKKSQGEAPKTASSEAEDIPPLPPALQAAAGRAPAAASPTPTPLKPAQGSTMSNPSDSAPALRPDPMRRPADLPSGIRPAGTTGGLGLSAGPTPAPGGAQPAARTGGPDPKTLIVGRDITLNGEISTCSRLVVEGKVEAALSDCNTMEIAESGLFKGAAEVQDADIRGRFEGKLNVRGRLFIRATGVVTGEVSYGQLEVECGGQVAGTVKASSGGL